MEIELTFSNEVDPIYDNLSDHFYFLADKVFHHLNLDAYFILEVNLVNSEVIHQINREHRKVDSVTDVISFAFEDDVQGEIKIKKTPDMPRDLGEIFICVDVASSQAIQYGHSFQREISFLFVHGLLHLLGYDHMKEEDELIMFKLQDDILDPLKL